MSTSPIVDANLRVTGYTWLCDVAGCDETTVGGTTGSWPTPDWGWIATTDGVLTGSSAYNTTGCPVHRAQYVEMVRLAEEQRELARPFTVNSVLTGRGFELQGQHRETLTRLAGLLGFELVPSTDLRRWSLRSMGTVMNAAEVRQRSELRARLLTARRSVAAATEAERRWRDELALPQWRALRISRLDANILARFIESVASWPEVVEVGGTGSVLDMVPDRYDVNGDTIGVRFWPVRLELRDGTVVYTPPLVLSVREGGELRSSGIGHPHAYGNGGICTGNLFDEYPEAAGDQMRTVLVAREWVVGYQPESLANQSWPREAHQWWDEQSEAFFTRCAEQDIMPQVLAVDAYDGTCEVRALRAAEITEFVAGWVPDEDSDEPESYYCRICGDNEVGGEGDRCDNCYERWACARCGDDKDDEDATICESCYERGYCTDCYERTRADDNDTYCTECQADHDEPSATPLPGQPGLLPTDAIVVSVTTSSYTGTDVTLPVQMVGDLTLDEHLARCGLRREDVSATFIEVLTVYGVAVTANNLARKFGTHFTYYSGTCLACGWGWGQHAGSSCLNDTVDGYVPSTHREDDPLPIAASVYRTV
jgi:hypothetical protein